MPEKCFTNNTCLAFHRKNFAIPQCIADLPTNNGKSFEDGKFVNFANLLPRVAFHAYNNDNDKIIELYNGLPQGVTSEVTLSDGECVHSNGCEINSSDKGTINSVNADALVANQHKISDNAITATFGMV